MDYKQRLEATKESYPFERWREMFFGEDGDEGLTQYTEENCNAAKAILDTLIADLAVLGEDGSEKDKLALFEKAVVALNTLNDENDGCLIETGEREDLCELINVITVAAGLDPEKYGDGEGPASEWRDW